MSNIIKELHTPLIYNDLPWKTINFLTDYKKKLDIQEILCLIENMYIETKDLSNFKIINKKMNSLFLYHPETERLYQKGWIPNNYLLSLNYFNYDNNIINNDLRPLYEKILVKYGYQYIKRIIGKYFDNISRNERFNVYKRIAKENELLDFDKIINGWESNSFINELAWLKDKEYGITLPVCYYSYGHIYELKKAYECFVPYWELEMELESLDQQQFIWKMEFYFNNFKNIKSIILRDPYHSIRNNKLLSFEKDFYYKINIEKDFELTIPEEDFAFEIFDLDLNSALNTNIYKMLTEEAIILGKNKNLRFKSYQKMFDNLNIFSSRKLSTNFLDTIYDFNFDEI